MGLALVCDVVIAGEQASFACSFGKVGLVPDTGVSHLLVRTLGHARAFELASTGQSLRAAEGLELGLVNAVVPVGELEKRVQERADAFASGPSTALALTKPLFHLAAQAPWPRYWRPRPTHRVWPPGARNTRRDWAPSP